MAVKENVELAQRGSEGVDLLLAVERAEYAQPVLRGQILLLTSSQVRFGLEFEFGVWAWDAEV